MILSNFVKFLLRRGVTFPRPLISHYLEWSLLRDILQALSINCVLDVGANKGQFAINLRRIGYRGHIISFEPSPNDYAILSRHLRDDSLWKGFDIALGSENTSKPFNVSVGSTDMSSFLKIRDESYSLQVIPAEIKRLDSIFDEVVSGIEDPRIFLKMDTQGYDLEVIKGAEDCLEDIICMQSEVSVEAYYENMPSYLEAIGMYQNLGFHLVGIFEVSRNRTQGNIKEMNCLMARQNTMTA